MSRIKILTILLSYSTVKSALANRLLYFLYALYVSGGGDEQNGATEIAVVTRTCNAHFKALQNIISKL